MSTKKVIAGIVSFGLGLVEGAIGNAVIKKHLKDEGWRYNAETNQWEIKTSIATVALKEMEAEHYKNSVYAVVGTTAFLTGLIIRKMIK